MADAGRFAEWAVAFEAGLRTGRGSDVPCDGCVACCTSGQEIVVDDDEAAALPAGAVGPDGTLRRTAEGRCVLLDADDRCTAYAVRPTRCRTYDCRIFPATGLRPEADKPAIADRAAAWTFRFDTAEDAARRDAVRMAVVVLRTSQTDRPASATQLAAAALALHTDLLP